MTDRRHFLKGIAGLALVPGVARSEYAGKCRVCVLGVSRAVGGADALRWSAPFWLDQGRFELSVMLIARDEWGPGSRLVGARGDVPPQLMRGWGNLSWMAQDLRGIDHVMVLVDLSSEARETVALQVIAEARRIAPRVSVFAYVPWIVADGRLVPDASRDVMLAKLRVFSACEETKWIQGDGAAVARLRLEAYDKLRRSGKAIPFHRIEPCIRAMNRAGTDQLAAPVINVMAHASRRHLLPSSLRGLG